MSSLDKASFAKSPSELGTTNLLSFVRGVSDRQKDCRGSH